MIIEQMDESGSFKTVHELIFFVHQDKLRITAVLEMAWNISIKFCVIIQTTKFMTHTS